MDHQTLRHYEDRAEEICARYQKVGGGVDRYFDLAFPPGGRILDVGCGMGRDLAVLQERGHDVWGVEPSGGLRQCCGRVSPELSGRVIGGCLPGLPLQGGFDGILCSAVLMHLPESQLFDAAFDLKRALKPEGRLLISIPATRDGVRPDPTRLGTAEHRDRHGRLFVPLLAEEVCLLFERIGFVKLGSWENPDALGREGSSWTTLLFRLESGTALRPIDQIEGVLNRDKKTATYKLALFRALTDIALQNHRLAKWRAEGVVGLPLDEVVDRWIVYYWPLFDPASPFIPQLRGETETSEKPVRFRRNLAELAALYRPVGGRSAFLVDYRSGILSTGAHHVLTALKDDLRQAIRQGPVVYAGGSLSTGRLFSYDGKRREILIDAAIWREFCLAGPWIRDALILRWAELTEEISRKRVEMGDVIGLLARPPLEERSVLDARRTYLGMDDLECVWTGESLQRAFDVDHVMPFSLWQNNDLWNLLPALPAVNNQKRDRLPERSLLRDREQAIRRYWSAIRGEYPIRFSNEAMRLTGVDQPDLDQLFGALLEAVEVTAQNRGCERWAPG